jgi:hypothetical protein
MGFLDKILSVQFGSYSTKKAVVNNWRSAVEPFEELEELPFQDPHYYSDSEIDEQDSDHELIQNKSIDRQFDFPDFVRATAHISQIQREPLVMQAFDYNNVAISPWRQTFDTKSNGHNGPASSSYKIRRSHYNAHGVLEYDVSDDEDGGIYHFNLTRTM